MASIPDLGARLARLRPKADFTRDIVVQDDKDGIGPYIAAWDKKFDPIPTDVEILAVDLLQPTPDEVLRADAIQILKADVPEAWKTSTNAQQRIAWAMKRLFVEVRNELRD